MTAAVLQGHHILTMRTQLRTIFIAASFVVAGCCAATADDRSLAEKWAEVEANAAIFLDSAERLGLSSSWTTSTPVRLVFDPPANEEQIGRAEFNLGAPLPENLRSFFLEASAGVHILWLLPGEIETLPGGLTTVRYRALPPPPWQKAGQGGGRRVPVINGGVLSFSLDAIPGLNVRAGMWSRLFRREADAANEPAQAKHYLRYTEFWERGLPLSSDGAGGVLAIDRDDPEGRLIFLRHEGDGEPGWFLGQSLIDFMVAQSRLGFPGIGEQELLAFSQTNPTILPMVLDYEREHRGEALEFGLSMPRNLKLDMEAPGADIWRAWLGL